MKNLGNITLSISFYLFIIFQGLNASLLHPSCKLFLCENGLLNHHCKCSGRVLRSESHSRISMTITTERQCSEEDYELALQAAPMSDLTIPTVCHSSLLLLNQFYGQDLSAAAVQDLKQSLTRVKRSNWEPRPRKNKPNSKKPNKERPIRGQPIRDRMTKGQMTKGQPIRGRLTKNQLIRGRLTKGQPIRGQPIRGQSNQDDTYPVEKMLRKPKTYYDSLFLKLMKDRKSWKHSLRDLISRNLTATKQLLSPYNPAPASTSEEKNTSGGSSKIVKRSTPIEAVSPFTKLVISWSWTDMYEDSRSILTPEKQKDQLRLALGRWERNSNLCFVEEDPDRSNVDVTILFDGNRHSLHSFNNLESHTKSATYIHLNKEWEWYASRIDVPPGAQKSAVLETVLQHEVGHLIGVDHDTESEVMSETYSRIGDPGDLSAKDRMTVKNFYGKCSGAFHTMIDLQWFEIVHQTTTTQQIYKRFFRTLITRDELIWQYSNMEKRPIGEYPLSVGNEFPGFEGSPTAIFQLFKTVFPYIGPVFVIKGDSYVKYVSETENLTLNDTGRVTDFGLPARSRVSSAVFDPRQDNIIFIVNAQVYRVKWNHETDIFSLQGSPISIQNAFPLKTGETNSRYYTGFDSIYIRNGLEQELYILKDTHIWKTDNFERGNNMVYLGEQTAPANSFMWDFICNPFKCKSRSA